MTPAVASERSIFSKNHDWNSYNYRVFRVAVNMYAPIFQGVDRSAWLSVHQHQYLMFKISNMADSDAFGLSSDVPSPGALLSSSPPRVERRTRRRLPPTPSLPPVRRSERFLSQSTSTSIGEGRSRLAGPCSLLSL